MIQTADFCPAGPDRARWRRGASLQETQQMVGNDTPAIWRITLKLPLNHYQTSLKELALCKQKNKTSSKLKTYLTV